MSGFFALTGGILALPDQSSNGAVLVRDGVIEALLETGTPLPAQARTIDLSNRILTPALIDIHTHGSLGIDYGEIRDSEDLVRSVDLLAEHGIGCVLPTLPWDETRVRTLAHAIRESGLPRSVIGGIYLEGPFVEREKRGGLPLESLSPPDPALLARILDASDGYLARMTIAPELPGADHIAALLESTGVRVCYGHSATKAAPVLGKAVGKSLTHLFNAMSGISHRDPGLALLPFVDEGPSVEINADGIHVDRLALRLCARGIAAGRILLISDSLAAAGLPQGELLYLGKMALSGEDGVRYAESGTLVGSNRLLGEIVRLWMRITGVPLHEAVAAATLNPARELGLEKDIGSIETGKLARLVSWSLDFTDPRPLRL
jgi:N-acetylglucosamine-6-phosphate deacetylase